MKEPYALISFFYDLIAEPFMASFKEATAKMVQQCFYRKRRVRILEAACGTGTQARLLARNGFVVCGLEKAPGMISRATRKVTQSDSGRLFFLRGDLEDIPLATATFDAVIVQMTLHELAPEIRCRSISELKRVAKPDAVFICVDFVPVRKRVLSDLPILMAELAAGKTHYRNGRQFVRSGGLIEFLIQNGFKVKKTRLFKQGRLCLAVAANAGKTAL